MSSTLPVLQGTNKSKRKHSHSPDERLISTKKAKRDEDEVEEVFPINTDLIVTSVKWKPIVVLCSDSTRSAQAILRNKENEDEETSIRISVKKHGLLRVETPQDDKQEALIQLITLSNMSSEYVVQFPQGVVLTTGPNSVTVTEDYDNIEEITEEQEQEQEQQQTVEAKASVDTLRAALSSKTDWAASYIHWNRGLKALVWSKSDQEGDIDMEAKTMVKEDISIYINLNT